MIGAVIGSYRVTDTLGKGGMGTVYAAEHSLLGRRAAIKVLLPELSARREIVARFFNEARAATSISESGIVQVFDFGYHTDGAAYIVMERLEGETLGARLQHVGALPIAVALRLAHQIAVSLGAAHAKRIVHRDLKPANVFLVDDPHAPGGVRTKLLDFGIAKLADDERGDPGVDTATGTIMGTPAYMSPEQCRGTGEVDHRADIYAFGCVLFRMITGRLPFEAAGAGELIASHLREPAPAPSEFVGAIGPEVDALVLRCLEKSPARRFLTMADVTAAIAALPPQPEAHLASASGDDDPEHTAQPALWTITTEPPVPTPLAIDTAATASAPPRRSRRALGIGLAAVAAVGLASYALRSGKAVPARESSTTAPAFDATLADAMIADAPSPVVDAPRADAPIVEIAPDARPRRAPAPPRPAPDAAPAAPPAPTDPLDLDGDGLPDIRR